MLLTSITVPTTPCGDPPNAANQPRVSNMPNRHRRATPKDGQKILPLTASSRACVRERRW
jgi:hypothetical protein